MPRLIKDGAICEDTWLAAEPTGTSNTTGRICSLEQWQALADKSGSAVQLDPGDDPALLYDALDDLALVAINFPAFTDGRGFSYARDLRERGYRGELRAVGHFIRDQMTYLGRVGFNAFQPADDSDLDEALASLRDFSEFYQAAIDQPEPLFRRRG
jgi:uncharacterized protein (DUF934 family)